MEKCTPYNTGKVKIGVYYTPPKRVVDLGTHAELLQRALITRKTPWYRRLLNLWSGYAQAK